MKKHAEEHGFCDHSEKTEFNMDTCTDLSELDIEEIIKDEIWFELLEEKKLKQRIIKENKIDRELSENDY